MTLQVFASDHSGIALLDPVPKAALPFDGIGARACGNHNTVQERRAKGSSVEPRLDLLASADAERFGSHGLLLQTAQGFASGAIIGRLETEPAVTLSALQEAFREAIPSWLAAEPSNARKLRGGQQGAGLATFTAQCNGVRILPHTDQTASTWAERIGNVALSPILSAAIMDKLRGPSSTRIRPPTLIWPGRSTERRDVPSRRMKSSARNVPSLSTVSVVTLKPSDVRVIVMCPSPDV